MALVYKAGYATIKDIPNEAELFNITAMYRHKYGKYLDTLYRRGIKTLLCIVKYFVLFNAVKLTAFRK